MGFSQYRSGVRINAVSSTGFITQGVARGKPLSVWNVLPTRNGILSTLLLMSFIVNLYFYLENQEVLHKLAISELENKNQDIKCEQVLTHTKLDQAEGLKANQQEELSKLHEQIVRLEESARRNEERAGDAERAKEGLKNMKIDKFVLFILIFTKSFLWMKRNEKKLKWKWSWMSLTKNVKVIKRKIW